MRDSDDGMMMFVGGIRELLELCVLVFLLIVRFFSFVFLPSLFLLGGIFFYVFLVVRNYCIVGV